MNLLLNGAADSHSRAHKVVSAIVTVSLLLLSLFGLFSQSPIALGILNQQQSSSQVVFSDNFESYASTETCNSVNDSCDAPPHIGNATNLPSYWVPASSKTCLQRGGCVTWDDNKDMGPGSVFAVVTEQAAPGDVNSLKMGASNYYADKTSAAVWLSPNDFPSGQPVSFTFQVWLSSGTDNPDCHCNPSDSGPNNAFVIQAPVGKIRYYGQVFLDGKEQLGLWEIQNSTSTDDLVPFGDYHLATQTWHTITVTFDWTHNHWDSLVIDGQQPFANFNGYPTYQQLVYPGLTYVDFELFIDPFADNQSITSAPSHGFQPFYAYIDNVNISLGGITLTSTSISLNAPSSVSLGSSANLAGSISPNPGSVQVTLSLSSDGITYTTFITTITDATGSYSVSWIPPYPGSYSLEASWSGNNQFAGSTSTPTSLTVTGTVTPSPTLLLSAPSTASQGQIVEFSIRVFNPTGTGLATLATIQIQGPNNYALFETAQTNAPANSFSTVYYDWTAPNQPGTYSVTVGLLPTEPAAIKTATIQVT